LSKAVIEAARVHWALEGAAVSLVATRENRVYRVDWENRSAALRLHRPGYRNAQQIHSELMWMDMLAKNGISVPTPIPATDGTLMTTFDDISVDCLSWVTGTPQNQTAPSTEVYYNLGSVLARTHTLADNWLLPDGFSRPNWDLVGDQPTWGRFWENPMLMRQQRCSLEQFRQQATTALADFGTLDYGLIHADLVPDNVLCHGTQLTLIDFDDGGFGHRLFDLATITHRSRRINGSNEYALATIAGYESQRQVNHAALTLFEAMRACSYIGWNMSRLGEDGAQQRHLRFIDEAETAIRAFYDG